MKLGSLFRSAECS